MAKKTTKVISGGARLIASGRKPMTLGLTPEQHEEIRKAAEIDGRQMAPFVLYHALKQAKKILAESAKDT